MSVACALYVEGGHCELLCDGVSNVQAMGNSLTGLNSCKV